MVYFSRKFFWLCQALFLFNYTVHRFFTTVYPSFATVRRVSYIHIGMILAIAFSVPSFQTFVNTNHYHLYLHSTVFGTVFAIALTVPTIFQTNGMFHAHK